MRSCSVNSIRCRGGRAITHKFSGQHRNPSIIQERTSGRVYQQDSQIVDQTQWVHKYGGPYPRLWRPPYGDYNATTLGLLHKHHMLMVLWTVDTNDWQRPGVNAIVHAALSRARPGAIILMHDAGGDRTQTIAALPRIVKALRHRGYQLVTVPRLILDDPPQHTQSLPHLSGD